MIEAQEQRIFVGLGANLGDARATVIKAMNELAHLPQTRLKACSSLYRSAPRDAQGPDFINAVAEVSTGLQPLVILAQLQRIEDHHGRARPYRNAPRTIDLDLLLWGSMVLQTPQLTLPHPRLHQRAFVLRPLAELAPELKLPGLGLICDWLAAVSDQRTEVLRP